MHFIRMDKSHENVIRIVEMLAENFGVSKSMTKHRMIELWFLEAEEVYCFVSGRRIPNHKCSDEWEQGLAFSFSRKGTAKLIGASREFQSASRSSVYSYMEEYCYLMTASISIWVLARIST